MRYFTAATILFLVFSGTAQTTDTVPPLIRDTAWKAHGFFGITGSQTTLSDWQGGGQNNVAVTGIINFDLLYKRDEFEQWQSKIDALFGVIKQGEVEGLKKNLDRLFLMTKYNTKAFGRHWFWAAQADYRTQFAPGYDTQSDTIVGRAISDINSPGYLQLGLGIDYKPVDYFSFSILPVAGKVTFVNRQYLADEGAFGVDPAVYDNAGHMTRAGKKVRYEAGGRLILKFKKDIVKNVNLDSYLDLFSNYFDHFGNVDVMFNNMLTIKVAKYFTVNVISQILYDDDVIRKRDWNGDGKYDGSTDINGPRVQALTTIAFGVGYKF